MAARSMESASASRSRASSDCAARQPRNQRQQFHRRGHPGFARRAPPRLRISFGASSITSALPTCRSTSCSRGRASHLDLDRVQKRAAAPMLVECRQRQLPARHRSAPRETGPCRPARHRARAPRPTPPDAPVRPAIRAWRDRTSPPRHRPPRLTVNPGAQHPAAARRPPRPRVSG